MRNLWHWLCFFDGPPKLAYNSRGSATWENVSARSSMKNTQREFARVLKKSSKKNNHFQTEISQWNTAYFSTTLNLIKKCQVQKYLWGNTNPEKITSVTRWEVASPARGVPLYGDRPGGAAADRFSGEGGGGKAPRAQTLVLYPRGGLTPRAARRRRGGLNVRNDDLALILLISCNREMKMRL